MKGGHLEGLVIDDKILKLILWSRIGEWGLASCGLGSASVAGSCGHSNEPSISLVCI